MRKHCDSVDIFINVFIEEMSEFERMSDDIITNIDVEENTLGLDINMLGIFEIAQETSESFLQCHIKIINFFEQFIQMLFKSFWESEILDQSSTPLADWIFILILNKCGLLNICVMISDQFPNIKGEVIMIELDILTVHIIPILFQLGHVCFCTTVVSHILTFHDLVRFDFR